MSDNESEYDSDIPQDILDATNQAEKDTLPERSRALYEKAYNELIACMKEKKTKSFDERVILAYIKEKADQCAPTTLWPNYSMLKRMIKLQKKIVIVICEYIYMYYFYLTKCFPQSLNFYVLFFTSE